MPGLYCTPPERPHKPATDHDVTSLRLEMRASLKDMWEVVQLLDRQQEGLHKKFDILISFLAGDA